MLEHDHITLASTVRRLYEMVQELGGWELEEPDLNEDGQPIVQHIAERLGCLSQRYMDEDKRDSSHSKTQTESASPGNCCIGEEETLGEDSTLLLQDSLIQAFGSSSRECSENTDIQSPLLIPDPMKSPQYQEYI